ncbi:MAG: hypothetical protein P1U53_00555 [Sulfitobacter sp.]|nr:hypothetical protein [Sulfitobacter sp.]
MTGMPPYLSESLASLTPLNQFVGDRALRTYQSEIARDGTFSLICPHTGQRRNPEAHYLLPGAGVIYRFGGSSPFMAVAASLKDGFPLLCLATDKAIHWAARQERADLAQLAQELLEEVPESVDPGARPSLHIGDPNFAHCLWNEFPALHALQQTDAQLHIHFDPLDLLGPYAAERGFFTRQITNRAACKGWQTAPTAHLGAIHCATPARSAAARLIGLPPAHPSGLVWISLRDRGRTAENQVDFIIAAIRALAKRDPTTRFCLDGFSTPLDLDRPLYDPLRHAFAARSEGGRAIAAEIAAALPGYPIKDFTGEDLHRALRTLRRCAFYISHPGTMQHKPAWLTPLPGIIHGNRASLSPGALRWNAGMIAGTLQPAGLSPDLIEDTRVRGAAAANDRNRDYRITDIPGAVKEVLAHLDRTDALTPSRQAG